MTMLFTPPHTSWTHRLARALVRPMLGTWITPNDLTTARLGTGIVACALFIASDPVWDIWGAGFWVLSCLLDRADGELARLGNASSAAGHRYDYYCDVAVNGLFFLAVGIALRNSGLHGLAIALGLLAGLSVAAASVLSEMLESASDGDDKAYAGILGFDFDDVLYLLGPAACIGLFPHILIGAAVVAPFMVLLTWHRLARIRTSGTR